MKASNPVTIGLRARTGRAIVVVLGGPPEAPQVLFKTEIKLVDPNIPETFQPYHQVMELRWAESEKAVGKFTRAIAAVAREALAQLIKQVEVDGRIVSGVGVVGSKDRDFARIGNYHIRAHAAEGILFRRVLELAAEARGLATGSFADRELENMSAKALQRPAAQVKRSLQEMGHDPGPPWRTDEKQAALAAWMMLLRLIPFKKDQPRKPQKAKT